MLKTRIFQNGNSQALRIPQELRTDTREYCISKIGNVFIAYQSEDPWAPDRQVIGTFPDDLCQTENSLRLLHFYVEFDEIKYKNLSCRVKKYIDATREALYCIDAR